MIFDISYIDLESDLLKNLTSFVIREMNVYVSAKFLNFFRDAFSCISNLIDFLAVSSDSFTVMRSLFLKNWVFSL
jgi:hypothetical protein